MYIRGLLATAALASLPAVASAQGVTMASTVTLGFSFGSVDGIPGTDIDLNTTSIDFASDIMFGTNFGVGLDFAIAQTEVDIAGAPFGIDLDLIGLAIEPVYYFGNGAYAGLYYRMGDLDLSISAIPITFGVDTRSFGVFGGYESGPLWVEGYVGSSDTDPGLPGSIDVMDYGLYASYDVMPNLEVFGGIARTDIDAPGFGVDLTMYSIGADYDFGNGLGVYGSVDRIDIGTPIPINIDATAFTLGLGYDLGQSGAGVPVNLNLEFSRTTLDLGPLASLDVDRIGLGVTIPIGGGSSQPLNSNTRAARGDYRSVIAAMANSL